MKQILLLTDFSENSKNAINYALQLYEKQKCIFYVLNTQKPERYTTSDLMLAGNKSVYDSLVKKTKQKLERYVKSLQNKFQIENHQFNTIVDYDSLTDAINQIIQAKNIELIVMGSNGATGAKEIVFGSNAIQVIRKVNCTTLVIPERFKFNKPKNILLPLDSEDSLSSKAFKELHKFVKWHKIKLHILRIQPNNNISKFKKKDTELIDNLLINTSFSYKGIHNIPIHYAVDSYLQTNNIDLITLLVQKESAFERFFGGSATKKISYNLRVPLLIYHSK
ncbi:universal stress protein [Formosa maritima]|uniref:Universal stress protein n=1 Tax=Formosa maritima TaxID=2592046 RepID=A0A5D0GKJ7_9FLAO|nr:universal stress protein [Formosa maritima]TYA58042.1 universal stress protein [Formosa maritima]